MRDEASGAAAAARVLAWLECDECGEGQLDAVVALGDSIVPTFAEVLREGLSPVQRRELELQLAERWRERSAHEGEEARGGRLLEEKAYVAHHLASRESLHRVRAAIALGRIRGDAAIRALRAELGRSHRPSVEHSIRDALALSDEP